MYVLIKEKTRNCKRDLAIKTATATVETIGTRKDMTGQLKKIVTDLRTEGYSMELTDSFKLLAVKEYKNYTIEKLYTIRDKNNKIISIRLEDLNNGDGVDDIEI